MSHPLKELGGNKSAEVFSQLLGLQDRDPRLTNAFCITVYNEPDTSLQSTLHSVLQSLRHSYFEVGADSARSLICILVDGKSQMHPGMKGWLKGAGLLLDAPSRSAGLDIHVTSHHGDTLTRTIEPLASKPAAECMLKVQVMLCVKNENRGKLESHALFFREICTAIQPEYCYQIDAGTTVAEDAISRLICCMENSSDTGAIAPRVMPAVPAATATFLQNWQFYDFAIHESVYWPVESMTGFLSVVPGQTCVFRWRALRHADPRDGKPDPINAYLRGLNTSRAIERVMYLAEDRIIGSEIALAPDQNWTLDYLPEASATTDACTSYQDLFRQRRRWINSAAACRLWLLALWARIASRTDGGPVPTRKHAAGMSVQLLVAMKELLSPAQFFAAMLVTVSLLGEMWSKTPVALVVGIACLVAAATCAFVELGAKGRAREFSPKVRVASMWTAAVTGIYVCSQALSWQGFAIMMVPMLALPCMAMSVPRQAIPLTIRTLMFPLPHMVFSNILLIYSVLRVHNVAWGTKGLVHQKVEPTLKGSLKRLRNKVALIFVAANVAVACAAWNFEGLIARELNPVVEIAILSEAAVAMAAIGFFIRRGWRSRQQALQARSLAGGRQV